VDDNGQILDLTTPIWNKIYEILFGGFEDIGDEEEELSEDELEYVDKKKKTKHGYLKDGFVVDSVESGEEDDNEDDDDGDEEEDGEEEEGGGGEYVEEGEDEGEDNSGTELEESEYDYSDEEN
jgi:hypothetical protein